MIKLELTEGGKIYAGNVLKNGKMGSNFSNVTSDAIRFVLEHIVTMQMTGDRTETIELKEPVLKHGRPYKIEIKIIQQ